MLKKHILTENNRGRTIIVAVCAALILAVLPISMLVKADGDENSINEMRANLTSPVGGTGAYGKAVYELYSTGSRSLEVGVENANLPNNTVVTFYADGVLIGQVVVYNQDNEDSREVKLKLRTSQGQIVPTIVTGSRIEVKNGAIILVSGAFTANPSPTPTGSPTFGARLNTVLTGATINGVLPYGSGEYKAQNNKTEFETYVNQINLPVGTQLSVLLDNVVVGQIILNNQLRGKLELESEHGQFVPIVNAGSKLLINNGAATILSGTFGGVGTTPTPTPTPGGLGRFFEARMNGTGITPPVITSGSGEIEVLLNATETQATVSGNFRLLSSPQTAAKVTVTVGSTTTVMFDLGTVGGTQGNFLPKIFAVTAEQVQQLRTGIVSAFLNTVNFPNGEIGGRFGTNSGDDDFDGDGSDDVSVYRPSEGVWYIQNSAGISTQTLGRPNDKVVSADYDGDGKTDVAVFTNSGYRNLRNNGVWKIHRSSDNGTTVLRFGSSTDIPVRGDFNGDGRSDIAVFRPSTGVWYIQNDNGASVTAVGFGMKGDKPLTADFDGDGRSDIAVFRPSDGGWYWIRSSDGQFGSAQFGIKGDIPVTGDFDGDGKTDLCVFRPSDAVWYIQHSSDGTNDFKQFGLSTDVPVAGKYDGDGKTDIAVFRPSNGEWYIWRSSDGTFDYRQFGSNGDIPTMAP